MLDPELFLDAALASLRQNLPAKIAAINAERGAAVGGFDLKVPDDDLALPLSDPHVSYSTGTKEILRYPFVEVANPDFTIDNFSLAQYDAAWNPDIVVRVWYEAALDADQLDRALKRYVRAVFEILATPDAMGKSESIARIRGGWRTNPETNERQELFGAAVLVFTMDSVARR